MQLSQRRNPTRRKQSTSQRAKEQLLGRRLAAAAGDGDLASINELLSIGTAINNRNRRGETPLSFAAVWNQLGAAKLLLQHGTDPNIQDITGGTPLMLAAQHASLELVKLLLKHGADANASDKAGNGVLVHADWRNDSHGVEVRELIARAASPRHHAIA